MKRFRIVAYMTNRFDAEPDFRAEFNARCIHESLTESDGFARRFLDAVDVEGQPVQIIITEMKS